MRHTFLVVEIQEGASQGTLFTFFQLRSSWVRTGTNQMFRAALLLYGSLTLASGKAIHYPPAATNINNLTFALHGTGPPGIYNSSVTPDSIYGTYNWCNMPHVRPREYQCVHSVLPGIFNPIQLIKRVPSKSYTLQYVEVIHRHHKRTPYGSNTFFEEDVEWSCSGSGPTFGATRYRRRKV